MTLTSGSLSRSLAPTSVSTSVPAARAARRRGDGVLGWD
jgi:hypothetical protein